MKFPTSFPTINKNIHHIHNIFSKKISKVNIQSSVQVKSFIVFNNYLRKIHVK